MVLISRGTPILTKIYGRYSIGRAVLLAPLHMEYYRFGCWIYLSIEFCKIFYILRHIESLDACMEY